MNNRIKLTAAMAVIAILAGAYFFVQWRRSQAAAEGTDARLESLRLVQIPSEDFLAFENSTGLRLERSADEWTAITDDPIQLDQNEVRAMAWTLGNINAARLIDEDPADLGVYGLADPAGRALITAKDREPIVVYIGDRTPGNDFYYVRLADKPGVYTVNILVGERLLTRLDALRDKSLPSFDPTAMVHLRVRGRLDVEIERIPPGEPSLAVIGTHRLVRPFRVKRIAHVEKLNQILESVARLRVREFIDDRPASLAPYGLDRPAYDIFVQTENEGLHILIGNQASPTSVYAKLEGAPGVFTIDDIRPQLDMQPFDLTDKFALIVDIRKVDRMSVRGRGLSMNAEIKREQIAAADPAPGEKAGEPQIKETFFLNGREIEERPFKAFYQACIGLVADALNTAPRALAPEITIEYELNTAPYRASISLARHNRDFYAVYEAGGISELLVSTRQVDRIFAKFAELGF